LYFKKVEYINAIEIASAMLSLEVSILNLDLSADMTSSFLAFPFLATNIL